ncbi:hypothetical protein [Yinghuangia seranimata]|uniref:hypothetical protein n=1 Tax=Yinghuangia seranimata TaxID=408067 RepID=UPI00248AE96E|nr:hypothetical protein [Yinghuangia seranimata]MDI2129433.1 hypothetical protein [Yinghuangia seranimata]
MTARSPRSALIALLIIVLAVVSLVVWKHNRDDKAAHTPPPTRTWSPPPDFPDERPDFAAKLLAHLKAGAYGASIESASVTEVSDSGTYQATVRLNLDFDVDPNRAHSTGNAVGIAADAFVSADESVKVRFIVVEDVAGMTLAFGRGVASPEATSET